MCTLPQQPRKCHHSLLVGCSILIAFNAQFSTVYRHPSLGLYMLVTDSGLVSERSVVWESLADVDQGSSEFCNGSFSKPNIQESSSNSNTAVQDANTDLE